MLIIRRGVNAYYYALKGTVKQWDESPRLPLKWAIALQCWIWVLGWASLWKGKNLRPVWTEIWGRVINLRHVGHMVQKGQCCFGDNTWETEAYSTLEWKEKIWMWLMVSDPLYQMFNLFTIWTARSQTPDSLRMVNCGNLFTIILSCPLKQDLALCSKR